jgi:hypothetical protein
MIVDDFDVRRPGGGPSEHSPPLIVDPDRMPPGGISTEGLKSISGRDSHVAQHSGVIQLNKLPACDLGDSVGEALRDLAIHKDGLRKSAPETSDHRQLVS